MATHQRISVLAVAIVAAACSSPVAPSPIEGTWGGDHAFVRVTGVTATAEFDCAQGSLARLPIPDGEGRFEVPGTITFEAGPVPPGGHPPVPARYAGTVAGDVMELTVTLLDPEGAMGPFTLRRGAPSTVAQCRAV